MPNRVSRRCLRKKKRRPSRRNCSGWPEQALRCTVRICGFFAPTPPSSPCGACLRRKWSEPAWVTWTPGSHCRRSCVRFWTPMTWSGNVRFRRSRPTTREISTCIPSPVTHCDATVRCRAPSRRWSTMSPSRSASRRRRTSWPWPGPGSAPHSTHPVPPRSWQTWRSRSSPTRSPSIWRSPCSTGTPPRARHGTPPDAARRLRVP